MSSYTVRALAQYYRELRDAERETGRHACCDLAETKIILDEKKGWMLMFGNVGYWEYKPIRFCPFCGWELE